MCATRCSRFPGAIAPVAEKIGGSCYAPRREQQAQRAANESNDQALDERLPEQTEAPSAERGSDGKLAGTRRGAGELQIGEVGAADQQHETSQSEREPHDLPVDFP